MTRWHPAILTLLVASAAAGQTTRLSDGPTADEVDGDFRRLASTTAPSPRPVAGDLLRIGPSRFVATSLTWPSFSPDGRCVVATDEGDRTPIFDVLTGVRVGDLPPADETTFLTDSRLAQRSRDGVVISDRAGRVLFKLAVADPKLMAASRDGSRLAVASGAPPFFPNGTHRSPSPEPTITLWDTETGKKIADLGSVHHAGSLLPGRSNYAIVEECGTTVAFDEAGVLLTIAADGHVRLWEAKSGEPRRVANIVIDPNVSVTFAPDGQSIILPDNTPRRVNLATGAVTALEIPLPTPPGFPAGEAPTSPTTLRAMATTRPTTPLHRPRLWYSRFVYSPDGSVLAFRCGDLIERWDVLKQKLLPPIDAGPQHARLSISADDEKLATTRFGRLQLFNLRTAGSLVRPSLPSASVMAMTQTPDGSALIVGDAGGSLYRFDLHSGAATAMRVTEKFSNGSLLPVRAMGISQDGNTLWTLSAAAMLTWRDAATLRPTSAPKQAPYSEPLAVSNDDNFMIGIPPAGGHGIVVDTSAAVANEPLVTRGWQQLTRPWAVAISPNHSRAAIAQPLLLLVESLDLNDLVPGSNLRFSSNGSHANRSADNLSHLTRPFNVTTMHYTPDGRYLAGISADGPIMFDSISAEVLWAIPCKRQSIRHACLSDDGALMAYMDGDAIQIVTTDQAQRVATVPTEGPVRLMQFLHGGHALVLVEHGMNIRVVDWSTHLLGDTTTQPSTVPTDDWDVLFGKSPARSYAALFRLMKHPDALIDRAADIERDLGAGGEYGRWIAQLSSPDNAKREAAHLHLEEAGPNAAAAIRHALVDAPEGESRDRLQALSDLLQDAAPTTQPDSPPVLAPGAVRYVEALGWLKSPRAREALDQMTRQPDIDLASYAAIARAHQTVR